MASYLKCMVIFVLIFQLLWDMGEGQGRHDRDFGDRPKRRHKWRLDRADVENFKTACGGKCRGQTNHSRGHRDTIRRHMLQRLDVTGRTKADVDRQLDKMFMAKKAILAEQGLGDVEPYDDGVISGDIILNEEQSDRIIANAQGQRDPEDDAPEDSDDSQTEAPHWSREHKGKGKGHGWFFSRRKRAASLSLDTFTRNKWPTNTINYYANPSKFNVQQKAIIKGALDYIQSKTCLKFVERNQQPMIEYLKTDADTNPGICGWAYMGFQRVSNPVHINFNSRGCAVVIQGVISHETMHTLGFSHEHQRHDRDKSIQMQWSNIDPRAYDMFNKDDPFNVNPYCVPYDYESVMHYGCFVGAKSASRPSFTPRTNSAYYLPKIGNYQRPSANDILLINKLYCTPPSCKDATPYCGFSCGECPTRYKSRCPKSCNQCTISH